MTQRQEALCDHAYANGMRIAIQIMEDTENGERRVRAIADRLSAEALKVIVATRGEKVREHD